MTVDFFLAKAERKNKNCLPSTTFLDFRVDDCALNVQSYFRRSYTHSETPIILPFPVLGDSCPTRSEAEAGQAGIGNLASKALLQP
jgi:hypothetical protein